MGTREGSHRGDQQLWLEGFAELRDYRVDVVPFLQYEVREGREAREAGALSKAVIAICNKLVILQFAFMEEV